MLFCSLIKGITRKIRKLCIVLINSVLLNRFHVFGSCFTTLAIILVSEFVQQCSAGHLKSIVWQMDTALWKNVNYNGRSYLRRKRLVMDTAFCAVAI